MKIRAKILIINVVALLLAVAGIVYLRYPYTYRYYGMGGVWVLVATVLGVGAAAALVRTLLTEVFVVRRVEDENSEDARIKASVSNLSLGFIMTDAKNNIIMMNSRAQQILDDGGVPAGTKWTIESISKQLSGQVNLAAQLKKSIDQHKSAEYADLAYRDRILRVLVSPIANEPDKDAGCVIILEDITEQKVLERMRDEYFSIASHELRTPLTAIKGNTAMIKQFYVPQVKDTAFTEMVDDIHDASTRLIKIVNDFLDASRLEQGKIKFKLEDFQLDTVLESVAYETSNLAAEKANHIVVDKTLKQMPPIHGDKDRVKQVIYNLVGNAMKFTTNGTITLAAVKEGDLLRITVADTGPGISPEDQKVLFRKFQQVGNSSYTRETSRGTGLGLYISKLLIENMGGTIGLQESELGKGTTFFFTIPLAKS